MNEGQINEFMKRAIYRLSSGRVHIFLQRLQLIVRSDTDKNAADRFESN